MPRGRPKGSKNKGNSNKGTFTKLNKSGLKELKFDEETVKKLREINASDAEIRMLESPYQCTCCGRRYKKQLGNFHRNNNSVLWKSNNGYIPICKSCIDNLLDQYTALLGNQDLAIQRICQKFDIYFSEAICEQARKHDEGTSRISNYVSKLNLTQSTGKTYDTYLSEIERGEIDSYDDLENYNEGSKITKAMFERWQGNTPEDIIFLEEHYKMLKKTNPNADNNQEIFIKDLCTIKLLQNKAMKDKNIGDFDKCTKLYRDTFKQAGLQTVQEEDSSVQNPLGVNADIISQYTPEEFYKDKKLYTDFDGIEEYFETHVLRPMRNIVFNEHNQKDKYIIGDADETQ